MFTRKNLSAEQRLEKTVALPTHATDKRYSGLFSAVEQPGKPTEQLLRFGLTCATDALSIDLQTISSRIRKGEDYVTVYPGEHYKLLAAIVKNKQAKTIVELGTHLGYSSLCMKAFLPPGGHVYTFDIIPWTGFSDTILCDDDFAAGLTQYTDDLTKWSAVQKHQVLLESADIVFMDALKDGKQEYLFLDNFSKISFKKDCLFVFDDIRLWNMLDIWYHIDKPKIDMTSFGHWSGTGLVQWG